MGTGTGSVSVCASMLPTALSTQQGRWQMGTRMGRRGEGLRVRWALVRTWAQLILDSDPLPLQQPE